MNEATAEAAGIHSPIKFGAGMKLAFFPFALTFQGKFEVPSYNLTASVLVGAPGVTV